MPLILRKAWNTAGYDILHAFPRCLSVGVCHSLSSVPLQPPPLGDKKVLHVLEYSRNCQLLKV